MRHFFKSLFGLLRIALAVALALLMVGGVCWGIIEWRNERIAAPLRKPRTWQSRPFHEINSQFSIQLSTMWNDGRIYYNFALTTPEGSKRVGEGAETNGVDLTIKLMDSEGFLVLPIELRGYQISPSFDGHGRVNGWRANSSASMEAGDYQRIANWDVEMGIRARY